MPVCEWRDVPGYEGLYRVSDSGDVYSCITSKVLKHNVTRTGYHTVELFKRDGSKSKRISVHRIVAAAFIPNTNNYPQVNHKDENKDNNAADNLEWCTAKYNMNYGEMAKIRHTLIDYSALWRKELARTNGKAVSKPVDQFTLDNSFIATFDSGKEASRKTGVNHSHILECCMGKVKTAGGYIWKYRKVG